MHVQSSAETAAAETNEELAPVVACASIPCWCATCSTTSSVTCPQGCPARFCLASCFATHQGTCLFVASAKPVMMTFHESLTGPCLGWAGAQQGVPVLFNPCSGMLQSSCSAAGCFSAVSLHPLARDPTLDFWASLRQRFEYFQNIELSLSSSPAALGRSRAQVRDASRVLCRLVSRFRQALLDGSFWLVRIPRRGKFWDSHITSSHQVFSCPRLRALPFPLFV